MNDFIPTIELDLEEESNILINLESDNEITLSLDEGSLPDPYHGEYIVYPKVDVKQKLETKNKSMSDDVTVMEIPNSEVSNESGTTFIIGGM